MKDRDRKYGGSKGYKIITREENGEVKKYAQYKVTLNPYMDGGAGFKKWAEEFVCAKIQDSGNAIWVPMGDLPKRKEKESGRSYQYFWDKQCEVMNRALEVDTFGNFKHNLIVLCWPRGEGKSYAAVLIQLWKFFVWPHQLIVFGANSKEQSTFVHFDIARDIIRNSPKLLRIIGERNILEKKIRKVDKYGNEMSSLRAISTATGIVSNITGFTFSEMFDMRNSKFYTQLYGSIRNMTGALGTIDSTVSDKEHVLYQLYETYQKKENSLLFFSYRASPEADYRDYWHPNMTQKQIDGYQKTLPKFEFDQYFRNTWDAGSRRLFTEDMVKASQYIGIDGMLGGNNEIRELFIRIAKTKARAIGRDIPLAEDPTYQSVKQEADKRMIKTSSLYTLEDIYGNPGLTSNQELAEIGRKYKTDFAILAGVDRSDPMKASPGARTIVTIIAKGLPHSKDNPDLLYDTSHAPSYMYFLLGLGYIQTAELDHIKEYLNQAILEYDGIDSLCSERWAMWDMREWCEEQMIKHEFIHPSYTIQKAAFSELFVLYNTGRFKTPPTRIAGSRGTDILVEEAMMFDHDPNRRWYGSPQKKEKDGVQDDVMYALGWGIYGGREIPASDFRERKSSEFFGEFHKNTEVLGQY